MDPFDLSQRESQVDHSSAGHPVRDDDSICRGTSSPMPPDMPFPRGTTEWQESFWLWRDFPVCPPTFQPPRAGAGSCLSTKPDLDGQNSAVKVAGCDKQPRFKYLLELVQSKALSLQLPSPGGAPHLLACSPVCLPLCPQLRSEISSNTWQASGLRFGPKNVLSHRSWIFIQLPGRSYLGLRPRLKLRFLLISVVEKLLISFAFYIRVNKEYLCLSEET